VLEKERPSDEGSFIAELTALRAEIEAELGEEDLAHLRKIERWGRLCTGIGYATAWIAPNPISVVLLSQGRFTRWTTIAHHVLHKGYDRLPGVPERYTSRVFGAGWRRLVDWMDWIAPEAWHEEHNILHHYHLGDQHDPDLVEAHVEWLRDSKLPVAARRAFAALLSATWKFAYYAPNTAQVRADVQRAREAKQHGLVERTSPYRAEVWDPRQPAGRALWLRSILPYAGLQFGVVPALFLPLGPWAAASVLVNSVLAELLTNIHSFFVIVPNHCGDDVTRFDGPVRGREEFLLRQIEGSVNYETGGDLRDFLQGWLNYQIEHHLWPDLTMRQLQRVQPRLRALCEKHGVAYKQEPIFRRARKMLDIFVGATSMRRATAAARPSHPATAGA
jgi:fatty acid desaturase